MNWAQRVEKCGSDVSSLVQLHKDRLAQWDVYMTLLKKNDYVETRRKERKKEKPEKDASPLTIQFLEQMPPPWAKIWFVKDDVYVLLDAGFGSIDYTSDLDVNVVSTTDEVLRLWMEFTRDFVKDRSEGTKEYAASFCEYWDSNFYYEPGVKKPVQIQSKKSYEPVPWTKELMYKGFKWTTPETALYELQCVKTYCDAYESFKDIVVEGRVSSPRPDGMTLVREQTCYSTSLYFAEKFREACEGFAQGKSGDMVRYAYLKYAVTKIEALISVTSLAVCTVFGSEIYSEYVFKKDRAKYLEPYMSGIAAYEMLRNLQMHSHDGKYKSKYANRLKYAMTNTKGLCDRCKRSPRFDTSLEKLVDPVQKTNTADLRMMTFPIATILDFMDDTSIYKGTCPYIPEAEKKAEDNKWLNNLKNTLRVLCDRAYDYIEGLIKEETSEKEKGTEYVNDLLNS